MATKKQAQERTSKLQELGLTLDAENNYTSGSLTVTQEEIKKMKDDEWDKLISHLIDAIGAASIPFTPAEDVPQGTPVGEVVHLTFEQEVEQEVSKSIVKLDVNKEKAAMFKAEYSNLTIASFEDKEGLKAVEDAKKIVRKARTTLEAKRKEAKKYFLEVGKGIDAYASDVNKPIEEVESLLDAQLAKYKAWQDADDKRKEEEASKKRNERVAALTSVGMVFNGSWYAIGDSISMDIVTIEGLTDSDFEILTEKVKAEKERLDKDELEKRTAARKERCTDIGMALNDSINAYVFVNEFASLRFSIDDLINVNDSIFNTAIYDFKEAIAGAKKKVEQKADDERKKFEDEKAELRREKILLRQSKCENAGLILNPSTLCYDFKNKYTEVSISGEFIQSAENDEFNAKIAEVSGLVSIAKNNEAVAAKKEQDIKNMIIARTAQLVALGFINNNGIYLFPNDNWDKSFQCDSEMIEKADDQTWTKRLTILSVEKEEFIKRQELIAEEKAKEKQAIESRYQARKSELAVMGVFLIDSDFCFSVRANSWNIWKTKDEVNNIPNGDWQPTIEALVAKIEEAQKDEQKRIDEIDAENQRITPEIDKVKSYVNAVLSVKTPEIKDDTLIEMLAQFIVSCRDASNKLEKDIESLSK